MSIFDHFRSPETVARERHNLLLRTLKETNPASPSLEGTGIDAASLCTLVAEVNLFEEEKTRVLAFANRPEISERLPRRMQKEFREVKNNPPDTFWQEHLTPLNTEQMRDFYTKFISLLQSAGGGTVG